MGFIYRPLRLAFILAVVAHSSAVADGPLGTQAELEQQLKALEQDSLTREIKFSQVMPMREGDVAIEGEYRSRSDSALIHVWESLRQKGSIQQTETVIGKNPRYAFILKGSGNQKGLWVSYLGNATPDFELKLTRAVSRHGCNQPWIILGKTLGQWLAEPGFEVQSISAEKPHSADGLTLLRARYSPVPTGAKPKRPFPNVDVRVQQARRWRISSYRVKTSTAEIVVSTEYGLDTADLPVPTSAVRITRDKDGDETHRVTFNSWSYPRSPPPEAAFCLSSFGLPEPIFDQQPQRSWTWLWLIVAGFGLALGSFWAGKKQADWRWLRSS